MIPTPPSPPLLGSEKTETTISPAKGLSTLINAGAFASSDSSLSQSLPSQELIERLLDCSKDYAAGNGGRGGDPTANDIFHRDIFQEAATALSASEQRCGELERENKALADDGLAWKIIAKQNDQWNALPQSEKEAALNKALENEVAAHVQTQDKLEAAERKLSSPAPGWQEAVEACANELIRLSDERANPVAYNALRDGARALRSLPASGTLAGWKLVPVEPTETMIDAAEDTNEGGGIGDGGGIEPDIYDIRKVWSAMLSAAAPVETGK